VPKTVLDTDTLSEIYKAQNKVVLANAGAYLQHHSRLSYTSTSASELLFGLYAKDAKKQIHRAKTVLKANEEVVPTSEDYWLVAEINAALKRTGKPIGEGDSMIAAVVINRGLKLATGNTKHYRFVVDAGFPMSLVDWRES
jgi:tRNA(fMet)-specific endonuclease VapC